MVGHGDMIYEAPDSRMTMFGIDGHWQPLTEPTHNSTVFTHIVFSDQSYGYSCLTSFGRQMLVLNPSTPIQVIPCGRNGSSLSEWLPADPDWRGLTPGLFESCAERARMSKAKISGVLIHLGSNDAYITNPGADPQNWVKNFTLLVDGLRREYGYIPIVFARLGTSTDANPPMWAFMKNQQDSIRIGNVKSVNTDSLSIKSDGLHLDTPGLQGLGQSFANAISPYSPSEECHDTWLGRLF